MQKKGLVIYINKSTFIQKDIDILHSQHPIVELKFYNNSAIAHFKSFWKQIIHLILHIRAYKFIYICFNNYHALIPVLFGRIFNIKTYIMVGGVDAHSFPEFGYGNYHKRLMKWVTCFNYRLCNLIFPKHKSLLSFKYTYDQVKEVNQGYLSLCNNGNLISKSIVIPNGYDSNYWTDFNIDREKTFLTVAGGLADGRNYYIKGIDLFVSIAPFFPDWQFEIVGGKDLGDKKFPKNVVLLPKMSSLELLDKYNKAKFYLQLSKAEGFPNVLCEAILCGCIPIASNVFGHSDIINNKEHILNNKDIEELQDIINQCIMKYSTCKVTHFRDYVTSEFSLDRRKIELLKAIA